MDSVDRRQFRLKNKRRSMPRWLRIGLIALGVLVAVFVLANVVMFFLYSNKVLPNYSVAAVPIGNTSFDHLDDKVSVEQLLPSEVTFKKDDKTKKVAPKDLGIAVDWTATQQNIKKSRSWLPIMSLIFNKSVPAELKLDNARFALAAKDLESVFTKTPLPERIAFSGDTFVIAAPEPGYTLQVVQLRQDLVGLLERGRAELSIPISITNSTEPTGQLGGELTILQKKLDANISFGYGGQKKQLTKADIAGFFEPSGQTLKLSEAKIAQVVAGAAQGLGVVPVNQGEAVQASLYALSKQQTVAFALANQSSKVYRRCLH